MRSDKNSAVIKFIGSLFIIVIIMIICDFSIGSGLSYLYKKQRSGLLYRTTFSIDSTKADYIVVGSSRANHHYDPNVFEAGLGSTFYNCGRDGEGAMYGFAIISGIIKRYDPKLVIIDVRPDEFTESEAGKLSALFPYFKNPAIRPYINYDSKFQGIKLLSHIYPYNSMLTTLFVGLNKEYDQDNKGFVRLDVVNTNKEIALSKEVHDVDTAKISQFYSLMDKLNKRHIQVLIIISPSHYKWINPVTVRVCTAISKKYSNAKFLNYSNSVKWKEPALFSDDYHLNGKGAKLFSNELVTYIKQNYK